MPPPFAPAPDPSPAASTLAENTASHGLHALAALWHRWLRGQKGKGVVRWRVGIVSVQACVEVEKIARMVGDLQEVMLVHSSGLLSCALRGSSVLRHKCQ